MCCSVVSVDYWAPSTTKRTDHEENVMTLNHVLHHEFETTTIITIIIVIASTELTMQLSIVKWMTRTLNHLLQLMSYPLTSWRLWQPFSVRWKVPTHWRERGIRSAFSAQRFARLDWMAVIVSFNGMDIQWHESAHQHRLHHCQRQITQLRASCWFADWQLRHIISLASVSYRSTACAYCWPCITHAYWSLLPCRYWIKLACQFREVHCRLSRSIGNLIINLNIWTLMF